VLIGSSFQDVRHALDRIVKAAGHCRWVAAIDQGGMWVWFAVVH